MKAVSLDEFEKEPETILIADDSDSNMINLEKFDKKPDVKVTKFGEQLKKVGETLEISDDEYGSQQDSEAVWMEEQKKLLNKCSNIAEYSTSVEENLQSQKIDECLRHANDFWAKNLINKLP